MAETATAPTSEASTDTAQSAPAGPLVPGASSLSDVAKIISSEQAWRGLAEARAVEQKTIEDRTAATRPVLEAARDESTRIVAQGKEKLARVVESVPRFPAPPSIKLTDFLAPVAGEPPERSVGKMIQAMGLFAVGIGGLAKGDAKSGLSALNGALRGWHEGDKERADRAFADWQASTQNALKQWEVEQRSYQAWFDNATFSFQQMMKGAELTALINGNDQAAAAFASGTWEKALGFLQHQETLASNLSVKLATLEQAHADRATRQAETERHNRETEERNRQADAQRAEDNAARREQQAQNFNALLEVRRAAIEARKVGGEPLSADAVEMAAQSVAQGVPISSLGLSRRDPRLSTIINRAAAIRAESGDTAGSLGLKQAEYRASAQELARVQAQRGLVTAFQFKFDRDLEVAAGIAEKTDKLRGGPPAFNRWVLAGRKAIQGDPDVAALDAAVLTLTSEFSKISSGSTQGSDSARHEAQAMINSAMTPDQFKAVLNVLRQDAHNRAKGYDDIITQIKGNLGALTEAPKPAAPAAEAAGPRDVKVIRKRDKKPGTLRLKAGEAIPPEYELVK